MLEPGNPSFQSSSSTSFQDLSSWVMVGCHVRLQDHPEHKREDSLFRYKHMTVNHNHEFVRADNPWIHINGIERFWKDLKEYCKTPGMRRYKIKSYIGRYLIINRRRQNQVRRCTTEKERFQKRAYIAETAFHRMLATIADYEKKLRGWVVFRHYNETGPP